MNVAIVLLNRGRGSGEVARRHSTDLVERGHRVWLVHPGVDRELLGVRGVDVELGDSPTPVHEYLPSAGLHQAPVSEMAFEEAAALIPAYERALGEVIEDVDIVIGHHGNLAAVATARVARRHARPYVLFLHGTGIEPRHHGGYADEVWALIHDAIEGADGILVTTEYVRDALVRPLVDLPLERFLVLPAGVDADAFDPANTEGIRDAYDLPGTYIICPGALTTAKGPQNVVEASLEYADLAPTVFTGDGDLRDELEAALGARGRFLGFVSDYDRTRLINAATLLTAAPEKKEHFGLIYVEALAAGTPPVAYEGGGAGSIVTPDVGILTERDPRILGRAIRGLLLGAAMRRQMAERGRARALELFAHGPLADELEGWLLALLRRRAMLSA